jgi:hypothetical protein
VTAKSKTVLATDLLTAINDNINGDILPVDLRTVLTDYLDSLQSETSLLPTLDTPPDGTETITILQGGVQKQGAVEDVAAPRYQWWTNQSAGMIIATGVWTPIDWTHPITDLDGLHGGLTGTTTIAAGSNGAALPQATINVVDTSTFIAASASDPAWIAIRLADGKDRVIQYTGMTATTFTGCTLGVGSLATSQAVRQANCKVFTGPKFHASIAECAFAANATGGRGIRFRDTGSPFFFVGGQTGPVAIPNVITHLQVCMQTVGNIDGTGANTVEVFQSSGGALEVILEGISSPSLMAIPLGTRLHP